MQQNRVMQHVEEQRKRGTSTSGRKFRLETLSNRVLVALNGSPIPLIKVAVSALRARLFSLTDNDRTRSRREKDIFTAHNKFIFRRWEG